MKFKEITEAVNPAQTKRAAAIYLLSAASDLLKSFDSGVAQKIEDMIEHTIPGGDPGSARDIGNVAKAALARVVQDAVD